MQGNVTGPDGKPVSGAVVIWGDDPYFQEGTQEVRTDREGHFSFPPLPDGPTTVTVVGHDFAPMQEKVVIKSPMDPIAFQLNTGRTIRIRFVDKQGAVIPGVYVGIENWRGGKGLYNNRHSNVIDTGIPYQADEEGVYTWTWAPDDAVSFSFSKDGYGSIRRYEFPAGETEQTVTMR